MVWMLVDMYGLGGACCRCGDLARCSVMSPYSDVRAAVTYRCTNCNTLVVSALKCIGYHIVGFYIRR
jgi:hypothetical protein